MTDLSPQEVEALIAQHGNTSAAARAIGVPRTTLQHWRWPEKGRARSARNFTADPEKKRRGNRAHYWRNHFQIRQRQSLTYAERALRHARQKAEEDA